MTWVIQSRRNYLTLLGTIGSVGLAGCSGGNENESPDDDSDNSGGTTDETTDADSSNSSTPPDVSFEFEFTEVRDDGGTTFTITHAGGEPLTAENTGKVVAYGEIMARDVFSSVGEDTDPEPFEPGDTSTHAVDDTTVTLYWTPPGKTLDDMEGNLVTLTEESAPENL